MNERGIERIILSLSISICVFASLSVSACLSVCLSVSLSSGLSAYVTSQNCTPISQLLLQIINLTKYLKHLIVQVCFNPKK